MNSKLFQSNSNHFLTIDGTPTKVQMQDEGEDIRMEQLAHDLKGPLNSIKGIVQFATGHIDDDQTREYFVMIDKCVDKLEGKIIDTLTMFKNGISLDFVQIDFDSLVDDIINSLRHMDGFDQMKLSIDIDSNRPFYSSRPLVESIIQNLMDNAIKYRCKDQEECIVNLTISDTADGIKINITDDGIGIAKEKLPRIFDANFRAVMTGQNSYGLGLFILQRAVKKLQGRIEAKSSIGNGTTFTIDLPNLIKN